MTARIDSVANSFKDKLGKKWLRNACHINSVKLTEDKNCFYKTSIKISCIKEVLKIYLCKFD